jgi:LacI family transcriptional regulator
LPVTLRDVAEFAGVSIGTASQALNNRPGVSVDARERVLSAAAELGYPVRHMAYGQTSNLALIGLLLKHDAAQQFSVNPFYSHIQAGVETECRQRGLGLMYSNIEVDAQNRPIHWPPLLNEPALDGLILAGTFIEETMDKIRRRSDLPVVLLDGYARERLYDNVVTDNLLGAFQATQYLIQQGHRHIGLIGSGENAYPSIAERRQGYLKALRAQAIHETYIEESLLSRPAGYEAAERLLKRAPQITAVFACNDETAIGVMKAAHDLGLDVPGNLSVIGFDDLVIAKDISPALTTIHVFKEWLGRIGVHRLKERLQNPDMPKTTTVLPTQLIIRDSVQCLIQNP